ncbi:hypothetical protein M514_26356 [Trichuris suis]|uniref:Uncharacterized protein n=1 Tax=Trichuris suis TaxID=68888 RepID=A0A085MW64_9BILA|nr:hypothetical protein M514_26356 [Trichuris suis]
MVTVEFLSPERLIFDTTNGSGSDRDIEAALSKTASSTASILRGRYTRVCGQFLQKNNLKGFLLYGSRELDIAETGDVTGLMEQTSRQTWPSYRHRRLECRLGREQRDGRNYGYIAKHLYMRGMRKS